MEPREFDEWVREFQDRPWDCGWLPEKDETEPASPLQAMRQMTGV